MYGLCSGTAKIVGLVVCGAAVLACAAAIQFTCTQHNRPSYRVPFYVS